MILARLHAAGFLPEVWVADEVTLNRRPQIAERMAILEQVVRTKGRIQAILHSNLIHSIQAIYSARLDANGWTVCRCLMRSVSCSDA